MMRFQLAGPAAFQPGVAMPRRVLGLALALALNALFLALLLARPPSAHSGAAPGRWLQVVWLRPAPPARLPAAHGAPSAAPASAAAWPTPAAPAGAGGVEPSVSAVPAAISSDTGAAAEAAAGATIGMAPAASVAGAVAALLAEESAQRGGRPPAPLQASREQRFGAQVAQAGTPDCLKADALKHDPPMIPRTRIELKGLLVLPHLAHAALTGKCR